MLYITDDNYLAEITRVNEIPYMVVCSCWNIIKYSDYFCDECRETGRDPIPLSEVL